MFELDFSSLKAVHDDDGQRMPEPGRGSLSIPCLAFRTFIVRKQWTSRYIIGQLWKRQQWECA